MGLHVVDGSEPGSAQSTYRESLPDPGSRRAADLGPCPPVSTNGSSEHAPPARLCGGEAVRMSNLSSMKRRLRCTFPATRARGPTRIETSPRRRPGHYWRWPTPSVTSPTPSGTNPGSSECDPRTRSQRALSAHVQVGPVPPELKGPGGYGLTFGSSFASRLCTSSRSLSVAGRSLAFSASAAALCKHPSTFEGHAGPGTESA